MIRSTKSAFGNPLRHLRASDLRGVARLATQATTNVSRIVEGVHQSVWDSLGVAGGKATGQTGGVTGLVYGSIRFVTQVLGKGVDAALGALQPLLDSLDEKRPGTPQREAVLAALNGVMGDRLLADQSPLATPMSLRYQGEALNGQCMPLLPAATGKILLLIHGLCRNDLQWRVGEPEAVVDHGQMLADALGYIPVYLRYNSGLHVSQNGRELAAQLERLIARWPHPLQEISVLAHSMGGLLIRSAVFYAAQEKMQWPGVLKHIVFLGTPHHGAPLERAGNLVDLMLGRLPFTAPFAKLGQLRSAGITDLRYGNVLDADWQGGDRFRRQPDTRQPVSLPVGVSCHVLAATTAGRRSLLADRLIGDGLVPLRSALGQHRERWRCLDFPKASQRIVYRTSHMGLLSSPEVAAQLLSWLAPAGPPQSSASSRS